MPYIRFTMDRDGKVLSSRLERSCGFPELDREAVALPRRASPPRFGTSPVDYRRYTPTDAGRDAICKDKGLQR